MWLVTAYATISKDGVEGAGTRHERGMDDHGDRLTPPVFAQRSTSINNVQTSSSERWEIP
jgi:hypothetical protein